MPAEGPRFSEEKHATCTLAAPARICAHAIDVKAARPELSRPTEARSPAMTEQDAFSLRSANDRCETRHPTAPSSPWSHASLPFGLAVWLWVGRAVDAATPQLRPPSHSWPDVTGHAKLAPVARGRSFDARSCLRQTHNPVPERGFRFTFSTRESPRSPRLRRRDPGRSQGIDPGKREPPCQVLPSPAHGVSCIR